MFKADKIWTLKKEHWDKAFEQSGVYSLKYIYRIYWKIDRYW